MYLGKIHVEFQSFMLTFVRACKTSCRELKRVRTLVKLAGEHSQSHKVFCSSDRHGKQCSRPGNDGV